MIERHFRFAFLGLLCSLMLGVANFGAQFATPPETYSITHISLVTVNGTPMKETVNTYRNGAKVMNELIMPPNAKMPQGTHARSFYDLQSHTSIDWDMDNASLPCTPGTFSGDWGGDPFQWLSTTFGDDLSPFHPKQVGTDAIAGIKAKVMELTGPGGEKMKIWVDDEYGLLLKSGGPDKSGNFVPDLEVTKVSFSKPPASVFEVPARCGKAR